MIIDASIELHRKKAVERFNFFLEKKKTFEITEKRQIRSLSQNAYLHLIISYFALSYGETAEYVKQQFFKKTINKDIFLTEYANRQTGEIREAYKSTAELDSKQMTTAIDRFRNYASKELGIYLPEPKDLIHLNEIKNEIDNNAQYL